MKNEVALKDMLRLMFSEHQNQFSQILLVESITTELTKRLEQEKQEFIAGRLRGLSLTEILLLAQNLPEWIVEASKPQEKPVDNLDKPVDNSKPKKGKPKRS